MCIKCFVSKNSKNRAENQIRGDKGAKSIEDVSNFSFMLRGFKLAAPHWPLILLALLLLLSTSTSSLFLPNFQGNILDAVIDRQVDHFHQQVMYFLLLSIATGLFGSISNLCFSIITARLSYDVRNRLYSAILLQDVAFFDGISTGELTSRLSGNVDGMLSPIQSVLSSFLQNILLFCGALLLCFFTSWRLAVLAITSISPIVQITRAYAEWSKCVLIPSLVTVFMLMT
jgi:ATP-binding cassette subfamily B protein